MTPKASEKKGPTNPAAGISAAQRQAASGRSRWPRCWPQSGDRVRFHCLTVGDDDNFFGLHFHRLGTGSETRHYVCLRVLSGGEEPCVYCGQGHDQLDFRFGLWIYVHNILHDHDNPEDEGPEWKAVVVKDEDTGRKRTLFREEVKQASILNLAGGRKREWFSQFVTEHTRTNDLQLNLYQLERKGGGRDDTDYKLTVLEDMPIPKEIVEDGEIQGLPTIIDVLREELGSGPTTAGASDVLGEDSLVGGDQPAVDGEAAAEEPAKEEEPEEEESSLI